MVVDVSASKNFRTDGVGMKVKRITAVAQTVQDLTTGSYVKNIHWSNVKVGTTSGSETLQTSGTFCVYPTSDVEVDYTSDSDENDWTKAGALP